MSNSSKTTDPKPLNKLFKDSFKKELIQKVEAGLINSKEVKQKYGIGRLTGLRLQFWLAVFR